MSKLELVLELVADTLWYGDKRNALKMRLAVAHMKVCDEEVERWGGDDRHPLLWVEKVVAVEVEDVLLSS